MKIIVDAMGGDNAPLAIVKGSLDANRDLGVDIILVGQGEKILSAMHELGFKDLPKGVEIAHASEVIDMDDDTGAVVKTKKDSSMAVALKMLHEGSGDAAISAGNSGALLTGATLIVKRIKGIRRSAFSPVIPTKSGRMVLIDCGANIDCTPEYVLQFALMGSFYASEILGIENPRVAQLNIGTEPSKGGDLQQKAYELLQSAAAQGKINFVGNIEGREAMLGGTDVLACDGFSGNIFLKTIEGTGLFISDEIKKIFIKNIITKIAALLVKGGIDAFKRKVDYKETGGTAILGISKPVIKAHGSSDARTFYSSIKQAKEYIASGFAKKIEANIDALKVEASDKPES